jgi:hypothetical protein
VAEPEGLIAFGTLLGPRIHLHCIELPKTGKGVANRELNSETFGLTLMNHESLLGASFLVFRIHLNRSFDWFRIADGLR